MTTPPTFPERLKEILFDLEGRYLADDSDKSNQELRNETSAAILKLVEELVPGKCDIRAFGEYGKGWNACCAETLRRLRGEEKR